MHEILIIQKLRNLRIRWEAIMRGTWALAAAVGRMVFKVWGLGAEGRMAFGMFWKSEKKESAVSFCSRTQILQEVHAEQRIHFCGVLLKNWCRSKLD